MTTTRDWLMTSTRIGGGYHFIDGRWKLTYDSATNGPTLTPSVLVKSSSLGVCHHFVRDGQIQYLSDCTHNLAGQTVPLPRSTWSD